MKAYLDKQYFSSSLLFFVFGNVDHAEIAAIMMIGGLLQIRGIANGIHSRLSRIHPSNVDLQLPQQKCGAQDLSWSSIFMPKYASKALKNFVSGIILRFICRELM